MEKLKRAIEWKERWAGLMPYIEQIENNTETNPNISLDATKSLLESIAKTILIDKGQSFDDKNVWKLVKQAFASLPIFAVLENEDSEESIKILWALATITLSVWTFRNNHWFISHWNDLQAKKFNRYLLELAIASCDVLSSFLIIAHSEDFKDRSRIYYDECTEFNAWFDENNDLEISWYPISASKALYEQDIEAYKDEYYKYQNDSTALVNSIENIDEDDVDNAEKITEKLIEIPDIPQENIEKFTESAKSVVDSYNKMISFYNINEINSNLAIKMESVLKNINRITNNEQLKKSIEDVQNRINSLKSGLEKSLNVMVSKQKKGTKSNKKSSWNEIKLKDIKR